jgi:hypothetical protein
MPHDPAVRPRITIRVPCPWPARPPPAAAGVGPAAAPACVARALSRHSGLGARDPRRRRRFAGVNPLDASVLVPLVQRDDGLHVLLTQRTEHLRDHAGQISFPGGRRTRPMPTPWPPRCAKPKKKSAWPASRVEVIGRCRSTPPSRASSSRRWSAWSSRRSTCARRLRGGRGVRGAAGVPDDPGAPPAPRVRLTTAAAPVPVDALAGPDGQGEYFIWGATAAMLRNLYRFLAA